MRSLVLALVAIAIGQGAARADGPPAPPPHEAHPRMLLDADLKAAWQAQAKLPHGPVVGAIALCDDAINTREHDRALYQGQEWAKIEAACLIAWEATDKADYQKTAIKFFVALIDDLDNIGDGKGGDLAARRDSGYAIRNLGPYTALGYDWLHDALPPDVRARALQRFKAWMEWWDANGYRAHEPGSNYHAGYLISATMIAIAEAGEAGSDGDALWRRTIDQMWLVEMAKALSAGGILDGGDWVEGFQYGPLSIGEIALGARLIAKYGVVMPGVRPWLAGVMRRHVYALTPGEELYPAGDTETEAPYEVVHMATLAGVALGDAAPEDKQFARGELARMKLVDKEYPLYAALAGVGDKPIVPPREQWPTWYVSANTNNLYARTRWDDRAIWFVGACSRSWDTDHRHVDAGNFVLSRGKDNVIVDPSPYGSLSSLTSNAPTVDSTIPDKFRPSQGNWGDTSFDWAKQTASGVIAARCDYAGTFAYKEQKSKIALARRDFVLLPNADGTSATLVLVDDATTADADHAMYLRFFTTGKLEQAGSAAHATVGGSELSIATLDPSGGGAPTLFTPKDKDCFGINDTARGKCEAERFPAVAYKVEVPGPHPHVVNLISATDAATKPAGAAIKGDGFAGVHVTGVRDAVVVWPTADDAQGVKYRAPHTATTHVVLGLVSDQVTATATHDGDDCVVDVKAGGTLPGRPLIVKVDANCALTADPAAPGASSAANTQMPRATGSGRAGVHRSGCCSADDGPGSPLVIGCALAPLLVGRRRRRRAVAARC